MATSPSDLERLKILEMLEDPVARNALALSLGDARAPGLPGVLIRLIQRPELRDHRGTLVHVLGFYDCSDHLPLLVGLVADGNWEVAHEAFEIIDTLDAVDDDDAEIALALTKKVLAADPSDDWRGDLLRELLTLLD